MPADEGFTRPGCNAPGLGDPPSLFGVNTPTIPVAPSTLLAVSRGVLAAVGFPDWVDPSRLTGLTLTRSAVTADWRDEDGGSHHFTIAVAD